MTTDYKATLNLPATEFPMKASLAQREPEILKRWHEISLYQRLRQERRGQKKFIMNDGPPYANGHLHIGHALNKILKDLIVKARTLNGMDAPFVPGWDCHGLPIELNVEKQRGKAGTDLSPAEFRQACRDYANSQVAIQSEEFQRLGVVGDWGNPYLTMDFGFEANIIRALAKIIENGHVIRGFKPVHWCIDCRSALAEAEVEYINKVSPAIDVRFRVTDVSDLAKRMNLSTSISGTISIPVWTTTPWTLPANEAVSLHPEAQYALVQINSENLILAEALLESSLQRYGINDYKILARVPGAALERLLLQHPFYQRQVPVVLGEHVTLDTGTGAVHTAPAHGLEDYIVGQKYNLPLINPVGDNGVFLPDTKLFAGEHVFKANKHIIEVLQEHHNLLFETKLEHSYPHCWRHKTALIFRATPQWFIAIPHQKLQDCATVAANQAEWIPEWGCSTLDTMIVTRPDWCISRQRSWGTPITIFVHEKTNAMHPDTANLMTKIADRVAQEGMEAWFSSDVSDWLGADAKDYKKVTDVLDVWFDSGVVHYAVLQQRPDLQFPADVVLEGSDQYRGWFQSTLLTAVGMQVKATAKNCADAKTPYRMVITHGFTVDDKGRKMSKSLGNVVAPEQVIKVFGADILRLWVAATDFRGEVAISDEILKRTAEAYRRIRNTMRYLLSNLYDFNPAQDGVAPEQLLSLDRWMMQQTQLLQEEIIAAYDSYQFHNIFQKLLNFCIVELGGFYLDITKDRQYTTAKNSLARRSVQTAMYHVIHAMVRWLAPVLSFTAEEIWQFIPGEKADSVMLTTWYESLKVIDKNDSLAAFDRKQSWHLLQLLREAVNKEIEKCRQSGEVGSSLEVELDIYCLQKSKLANILQTVNDELRFVLLTSTANVHYIDHLPHDLTEAIIEGEEIALRVTPSIHAKCVRCWHRRADVGSDPAHPELCARCVTNVFGEGEVRKIA